MAIRAQGCEQKARERGSARERLVFAALMHKELQQKTNLGVRRRKRDQDAGFADDRKMLVIMIGVLNSFTQALLRSKLSGVDLLPPKSGRNRAEHRQIWPASPRSRSSPGRCGPTLDRLFRNVRRIRPTPASIAQNRQMVTAAEHVRPISANAFPESAKFALPSSRLEGA